TGTSLRRLRLWVPGLASLTRDTKTWIPACAGTTGDSEFLPAHPSNARSSSPHIRRMQAPLREHRFRLALAAARHELIERAEISLGGGNQRIRIGTLGGHRAPALGKTHRHLRLRVGALCHRVHLIELEH